MAFELILDRWRGVFLANKWGAGISDREKLTSKGINICSGNNKWSQMARAKAHGCECLKLKLERWAGARPPQPREPRRSSETTFCKECEAIAGTGFIVRGSIIHESRSYCAELRSSMLWTKRTESLPSTSLHSSLGEKQWKNPEIFIMSGTAKCTAKYKRVRE